MERLQAFDYTIKANSQLSHLHSYGLVKLLRSGGGGV
jgi:hypothetical protein